MQGTVRSWSAETWEGSVLLDDGSELQFPAAAFAASRLRGLRVGQRVRLTVEQAGGRPRVTYITIATLAE